VAPARAGNGTPPTANGAAAGTADPQAAEVTTSSSG
jgi:hypothetical protein